MPKTLSLVPLLNEKTYELSKARGVYVFNVPVNANKHLIERAVKAQFDVEVISVNTLNTKGKRKRIVSITGKRTVNAEGQRAASKKAYVKLKSGSNLPFFESIEQAEEKRVSTQEKIDKAIDKQSQKESKKEETKPKRHLLRGKKKDQEDK